MAFSTALLRSWLSRISYLLLPMTFPLNLILPLFLSGVWTKPDTAMDMNPKLMPMCMDLPCPDQCTGRLVKAACNLPWNQHGRGRAPCFISIPDSLLIGGFWQEFPGYPENTLSGVLNIKVCHQRWYHKHHRCRVQGWEQFLFPV